MVLAVDTATHGFNPYVGYDSGLPYLYYGGSELDSRLPVMERVVGIRAGGVVRAYPFTELAKNRVTQETVGGGSAWCSSTSPKDYPIWIRPNWRRRGVSAPPLCSCPGWTIWSSLLSSRTTASRTRRRAAGGTCWGRR